MPLGFIRGVLGGPRGNNINTDEMLLERYNQLQNPNFMREDILNAIRGLQPTQNDIMSRLRGSGLGLGTSSILANRQFRAQQSRATGQAANAFTRFRLQNVGQANSVLGQLARADQFQTQRVDAFDNNVLGIAGFGLAGGFGGGGGV
jgi:hypothetical protein